VALACANVVAGAELRVLSAAAVKGPLQETVAAFERETGHRVALEFATAGQVESRIAAGERTDLVLNTRARLDACVAKGGGGAGAVCDRHGASGLWCGKHHGPTSLQSTISAHHPAASSAAYTNWGPVVRRNHCRRVRPPGIAEPWRRNAYSPPTAWT
jgi:hypothetical protein